MHYLAFVVLPEDVDPENALAALKDILGPYDENVSDDGWWDWWVIGGRWSGIASGYDPREDPDNKESCWVCFGTGMRMDALGVEYRAEHPDYKCNGCDGAGVRVKWPTDWKRHDGDVTTKMDLGERVPFTLVTSEFAVHQEYWDGARWVDSEAALLEAWSSVPETAHIAVVDYHS